MLVYNARTRRWGTVFLTAANVQWAAGQPEEIEVAEITPHTVVDGTAGGPLGLRSYPFADISTAVWDNAVVFHDPSVVERLDAAGVNEWQPRFTKRLSELRATAENTVAMYDAGDTDFITDQAEIAAARAFLAYFSALQPGRANPAA